MNVEYVCSNRCLKNCSAISYFSTKVCSLLYQDLLISSHHALTQGYGMMELKTFSFSVSLETCGAYIYVYKRYWVLLLSCVTPL